jgi:PhnB protein
MLPSASGAVPGRRAGIRQFIGTGPTAGNVHDVAQAAAPEARVVYVDYNEAAFGARVLHQAGEGDDIVAQLAVGDAAFWVSPGGADGPRFSPRAIGGATGRTLLVADDPDAMFAQAIAAGATAASEMADEHGWRLGRIFDPFGHEWEIGRPLGSWPPADTQVT